MGPQHLSLNRVWQGFIATENSWRDDELIRHDMKRADGERRLDPESFVEQLQDMQRFFYHRNRREEDRWMPILRACEHLAEFLKAGDMSGEILVSERLVEYMKEFLE